MRTSTNGSKTFICLDLKYSEWNRQPMLHVYICVSECGNVMRLSMPMASSKEKPKWE